MLQSIYRFYIICYLYLFTDPKFVDAFGDGSIPWLKKSLKSYDDYVSLERIISSVSAKTRLPVNSVESSISTREQAEELIRNPRWGTGILLKKLISY